MFKQIDIDRILSNIFWGVNYDDICIASVKILGTYANIVVNCAKSSIRLINCYFKEALLFTFPSLIKLKTS